MDEEQEVVVKKKKSEAAPPRRQPKKIVIPRRTPSVVVPPKKILYISADKTTCAECVCYPKEEPYVSPKKINPCQHSPERLYYLAAEVVDTLKFPAAFTWSEEDVVAWLDGLGLPQYRECIIDNHINGMRLLMLEDGSKLAEINIKDFNHIKTITAAVRHLFTTDFIRFARSVGLPPRKPLTHCTWFKSRTGPSWGVRKNWSRCEILRWMKIINPEPLKLDHWDLVWYQEPDFPKTKFARIPKAVPLHIPRYKPRLELEVCKEYQIPRKFRFQTGIPDSEQLIWMETREPPKHKLRTEKKKKKRVQIIVPKDTRLYPKKISLTGLAGKELVLARRKMPKPKFLA